MFTNAWRSSQKPRWRLEACATSVESHISSVGKSVVYEAVMAARVHEHDLEGRNLRWRVGFFRRQLRRVARLRVTRFLGFPYGRPRSMPVWLVSSGEGLICTDL